jgi:hypothetical protein
MRTNLQVPYAEKDLARRRGAHWDKGRKVWYVENVEDLGPFLRWMPAHLTKPCVRNAKAMPTQKAGQP